MSPQDAVEEVVRTSRARLVGYLASVSGGDLAAAEDALSDAVVAALASWPVRGVPTRPDAWLVTAARRGLVDGARRRDVAARAAPALAQLADELAAGPAPTAVPDRRLELLFVCAHPAVDAAVRSPLMLQVVLGLDAARIAAAFLVAPSAMGQRLVRAKAKVRAAGVPFRVPERHELPERLDAVLEAVYGAYTAGWDDPAGLDPRSPGLTEEALRLARLLAELLPGAAEVHGLLALLLHSQARAAARRADDGAFVALADQDTARWDRSLVAQAEAALVRAQSLRSLGPYQLQAAIASVHAQRAATGRTDWQAVALLYDGLVALRPTVGVAVARAAAHREASGASPALAQLDALPEQRTRDYQPWWVLRAHLLRDLGQSTGAQAAADRALALTTDPAVRDHLRRVLLGRPDG